MVCILYYLKNQLQKEFIVMQTETKQINPQTEANKKWQEKNREKAKYLRNRSTSRSFIKNQATLEDIEELKQLMKTRIELLASASEQTE